MKLYGNNAKAQCGLSRAKILVTKDNYLVELVLLEVGAVYNA